MNRRSFAKGALGLLAGLPVFRKMAQAAPTATKSRTAYVMFHPYGIPAIHFTDNPDIKPGDFLAWNGNVHDVEKVDPANIRCLAVAVATNSEELTLARSTVEHAGKMARFWATWRS